MFYSKSTGGFYSAEIHGTNIPSDSVEITNEEYKNLLSGQSEGKVISADLNGYPILQELELVAPTYDQLRAAAYPPMQDYMDGIVKNDINQVDKYIDDCLAVKALYPKP